MPGKMKTATILFLILTLFVVLSSSASSRNFLLGVKFISYTNHNGTIASGECCDQPGKISGPCPPDLCDTAFVICSKTPGSTSCDGFRDFTISTTYNNNSIHFGRKVGNGDKTSPGFNAVNVDLKNGKTDFTIVANEMPGLNGTEKPQTIAEYSFFVDWMDSLKKAIYKRFVLDDTHAQLVVDVVSQCGKRYFTKDCSVYCKSNDTRYKCSITGTKECFPGWNGKDCDNMIDYCHGNMCEHGSTCVPVVQGYNCSCPANYTGVHCVTHFSMPILTNLTTTPSKKSAFSTLTKMATTTSTKPVSTKIKSSPSTVTTTADVTTKDTSSGSKTNKSGNPIDSDGDDIAKLAAGVSVGVLFLLLIIVVAAYFIFKNKRRGQVTPNEEANSWKENEVSGSEKKKDAPNNINITLTQSVGDADQKHTFISGQHPPPETAICN